MGPRRSTQAWNAFSAPAVQVGYGGPADGDFVRYVDELMAQAEVQQRAQARTSDARRTGAPVAQAPAMPVQAHARALPTGLKTLVWRRLWPWALWLMAAVAVFFWQGAGLGVMGMLFILGLLVQRWRGKNP